MQGVSPQLREAGIRVSTYLILLLGIGVALAFLGIDVQPLLAIVIIVAVIAALALRGIADNFGASLVLQTRTPIRLGDVVELQDWYGVVEELNGRSVVVRTTDGRTVHLPNSEVLANPLVNYSRSGAHRSEIQVRVGRPGVANDVLVAAVRARPGVLAEPSVDVLVTAVEPSRTTLVVRFWHAPGASPVICSTVAESLAAALERHGDRWTVNNPAPDPLLVPRYEI